MVENIQQISRLSHKSKDLICGNKQLRRELIKILGVHPRTFGDYLRENDSRLTQMDCLMCMSRFYPDQLIGEFVEMIPQPVEKTG